MLLMDSTTILKVKQSPVGKSIVLLYFRPNCPHCQNETKEIINNIDTLKNVDIYLLADSAPFEDIRGFSNYFRLDQYKNIIVGNDFQHSFYHTFKPTAIPYIAIYNSQNKLIKIYDREVPISAVISAARS
jgi:hypothetical protein